MGERKVGRYMAYRLAELLEEQERCKQTWHVEKDLILHLLTENKNLWKQLASVQSELAALKQRTLSTEQEQSPLLFCTCTGQGPWTTTSTFQKSPTDLKDRGF
jgi:hypothetical protein